MMLMHITHASKHARTHSPPAAVVVLATKALCVGSDVCDTVFETVDEDADGRAEVVDVRAETVACDALVFAGVLAGVGAKVAVCVHRVELRKAAEPVTFAGPLVTAMVVLLVGLLAGLLALVEATLVVARVVASVVVVPAAAVVMVLVPTLVSRPVVADTDPIPVTVLVLVTVLAPVLVARMVVVGGRGRSIGPPRHSSTRTKRRPCCFAYVIISSSCSTVLL
jgi:hypothetical protein